MDAKNIALIYLSIQLFILSLVLLRSERRVAYLEGRNSVAQEIDEAVNEAVGPYTGKAAHYHGNR